MCECWPIRSQGFRSHFCALYFVKVLRCPMRMPKSVKLYWLWVSRNRRSKFKNPNFGQAWNQASMKTSGTDGLTSLAGLLQTIPVDICRAQFRGSIIRLVAMVLGYYPWYTSKRVENWAHCDLINHKFCQERSFWYYTSSQFETIWLSSCAQLCHRSCGFGMQFFRDSYPIPKMFEILI